MLHQDFGSFAKGARRVDDIIDDQASTVLHITDNSHFGDFTWFTATFVDDG